MCRRGVLPKCYQKSCTVHVVVWTTEKAQMSCIVRVAVWITKNHACVDVYCVSRGEDYQKCADVVHRLCVCVAYQDVESCFVV
jgi:hypothetical protein